MANRYKVSVDVSFDIEVMADSEADALRWYENADFEDIARQLQNHSSYWNDKVNGIKLVEENCDEDD